jgi:DNA polymerase-3 subunit epsilon
MDGPKTVKNLYEYRIEKITRLMFPSKPGIYFMRASDNRILYIGKATSLKSRINSYFRGYKNRNKTKLEMLAQVWDIQIIECDSALEAALLESDEIKKWDPPYNIALKKGNRKMIFYDKLFSGFDYKQTLLHQEGPYKVHDAIAILYHFHEWLTTGNLAPIFYDDEVTPFMDEALALYCTKYSLEADFFKQMTRRDLLAFCLHFYKSYKQEHGDSQWEKIWKAQKLADQDEPLNAHKVSKKIERLFIRAALTRIKSKHITKLLNCNVSIGK